MGLFSRGPTLVIRKRNWSLSSSRARNTSRRPSTTTFRMEPKLADRSGGAGTPCIPAAASSAAKSSCARPTAGGEAAGVLARGGDAGGGGRELCGGGGELALAI